MRLAAKRRVQNACVSARIWKVLEGNYERLILYGGGYIGFANKFVVSETHETAKFLIKTTVKTMIILQYVKAKGSGQRPRSHPYGWLLSSVWGHPVLSSLLNFSYISLFTLRVTVEACTIVVYGGHWTAQGTEFSPSTCMWVLDTELRTSGLTAKVLTVWATSLALHPSF